MHILITGGAGFIGTNLTEYLLSAKHQVTIVDNLIAGKRERVSPEATFFNIDVNDTTALAECLNGVDAVVHLAALPSVPGSIADPQTYHQVNVDGTLSVLEAARSRNVKRLLFASSSAVYGTQDTLPHKPSMEARLETPYAFHKYTSERMLRLWSNLYGMKTTSLRFFNVYGPHFDPEGPYAAVIGKLLLLEKQKQPLTVTGDGEQTRDFIYVTDVVRAMEAALTNPSLGRGEVLNVGTGTETTVNTIAKSIGGEISYLPARNELYRSVADITETQKLLDWQPTVTIEQGLKELQRLM
jgi:UDP-glucose 4-epimerase